MKSHVNKKYIRESIDSKSIKYLVMEVSTTTRQDRRIGSSVVIR